MYHVHTHTHTHTHTQCSSTWAGGTRERNVTCIQAMPVLNETTGEPILDDEGNPVFEDAVVQDELCLAALMTRRMDACNTQIPCPHRWLPGPWQEVCKSNVKM